MLPIASSKVGDVKRSPAPSFRAGLTPHGLVGKTFEPKTPVRAPKEESLLWCGQPRSVDRPSTSSTLSAADLSNSRLFYIGTTRDTTKNCESANPPDSSISGRGRNSSQAVLRPECSLHVAAPSMSTP